MSPFRANALGALLSFAVNALTSCVAQGRRVLTQGNGMLVIVDRESIRRSVT